MAKVADFISENLCDIKRLTKAGLMSPVVISRFTIYTVFEKAEDKSTMSRYQMTADEMRVDVETVRKAVAQMKKPM